MPRTARAACADVCYHVMSRGNARASIFHESSDYDAFLGLLRRAKGHVAMRILAWCLMPNHFHLALRPHHDGDLGRFMHWLLTAHVQRHRGKYDTTGRIWQGRFKALPVQQDGHLLTVLRYIERNPLRAGLVRRAEEWRWSSLPYRMPPHDGLLSASVVQLPRNWFEYVNQAPDDNEVERIRQAIVRGRPLGDPAWTQGTAERLGLLSALRARGRPRSAIVARG